jgi:hypothetical protein
MSVDVFALNVDSGAQMGQNPVEISSLEFLFKEKVQKPKLIRSFEFSRDYSITQDSSYTTNKSQNITICIENLISQRSGVPQETLLDPILLPTLKNPAGVQMFIVLPTAPLCGKGAFQVQPYSRNLYLQ